MSIYIYNGVNLNYVRTTFYECTTERDPTNTDVVWSKFTVRVTGFLNATTSGFGVTDSAAALQFFKDSLTAPRRSCTYVQGITPIFSLGAGPGFPAIDAKLGPEPLPTVVREITSGMFRIETGVIIRLVECVTQFDEDGNVCAPNPVVSLRWSQSESFDQDWYSHLTTEGRLIVRSDLLQSADNFRPLATPPILADYQRRRSNYRLAPDGLELAFTFEDVEMDRLPPFPATTASGKYIVVINKGGLRTGTVSIKLTGQKGTSRRDLLVKAFNMGWSKLQSDQFQAKTNPLVTGTFSEDLFVPSVEIQMQAMMSPLTRRGGVSASLLAAARTVVRGARVVAGAAPFQPQIMPSVGMDTFGLSSNRNGIAPPERKRIAGLLTAAFSDPCACLISEVDLVSGPFDPSASSGSSLNGGNTNITGATLRAGGAASFEVGPLPPSDPTPNVTDSAPYDVYQVESEYHWDEGLVQMPGTGVGDDGGLAAFVRVHGGMMTMSVSWVAGRTGEPPVLPAYQSADPNLVAIGGNVVAQQTDLSADGTTAVFWLAGYYLYGAVDPTKVAVNSPIPPFISQTVAQTIAPLAASTYTNSVIFGLVGQSGPNPFVNPTPVGTTPDDPFSDAGLTSANQLVTSYEDQSPTTSSSAGGAPTAPYAGLGGTSQGGGSIVGGGAPVYP